LIGEKILGRAYNAAAARQSLHHLHSLGIQFSISYALPVVNERFIVDQQQKALETCLGPTSRPRPSARVIDGSKVLNLHNFPTGTLIYLRAELLHPGAKASLFDGDGRRITAFITDAPRYNIVFLKARHWARGRRKNKNKTLRSTGLDKLLYWSFTANQAGIKMAVLAMNLIAVSA